MNDSSSCLLEPGNWFEDNPGWVGQVPGQTVCANQRPCRSAASPTPFRPVSAAYSRRMNEMSDAEQSEFLDRLSGKAEALTDLHEAALALVAAATAIRRNKKKSMSAASLLQLDLLIALQRVNECADAYNSFIPDGPDA